MSTELSHRTEFEQVEIIDSERMTNPPGWRCSVVRNVIPDVHLRCANRRRDRHDVFPYGTGRGVLEAEMNARIKLPSP
jgi:hypothetical protein